MKNRYSFRSGILKGKIRKTERSFSADLVALHAADLVNKNRKAKSNGLTPPTQACHDQVRRKKA